MACYRLDVKPSRKAACGRAHPPVLPELPPHVVKRRFLTPATQGGRKACEAGTSV